MRADRQRKSIGGERTWAQDLQQDAELVAALDAIIDIVWERIARQSASGRTLTLKMKFADFQQITRARSLDAPIPDRASFAALAQAILAGLLPVPRGVRLLGLSLSGLETPVANAGAACAVAEPVPAQYRLEF